MNDVGKNLAVLLADTYALYLKTQNYHWHVKGPHFKSLHGLFETQYIELAEAVDSLAERLLTMGQKAPATFKEFMQLKTIEDGHSDATANQMLIELAKDHDKVIGDLYRSLSLAQKMNDEGTANLLSDRINSHEKARWMLNASCE